MYEVHGNVVNLTGRTFGRLVVQELAPRPWRWANADWICRCECGSEMIATGQDLQRGSVLSCGCLFRELRYKHGLSKTPTYITWNSMRGRCGCKSNGSYAHYGGRGIKVCERWDDFENFLTDMGEKPEWATGGIDRIDVDGDYEPGNCRWATREEQAENKR